MSSPRGTRVLRAPADRHQPPLVPDTPVAQDWSPRQLRRRWPTWRAMFCIALVGALQPIDPSLHSLALPSAAKELQLDPGAAGFIRSLATIVLAASMLGVGIIGDRIGRKKLMLTGIALMATAAVLAMVAPNGLIYGGSRVLMGVGTAMSFAMCLAFTPTLFGPKYLSRAFGVFLGGGAPMLVLATLAAGAMQDTFGWRSTYGAVAALCVLMGLLVIRELPENKAPTSRKFDGVGVGLAALGLVILVYSLGQAAALGWGSPVVLLGLPLALVVLGIFTWWELRVKDPGLPIQLFKIPAFATACVVGVLFNWADGSVLGQFPALAIPHGVSPAVVSIVISGVYVGMCCGAPAAAYADHRWALSPRFMFTSGLLLCVLGLGSQLWVGSAHDVFLPLLGFFVIGFAVMWMQTPQSAVIMGSAPADQLGAVGSVKPAVGQFGFGLGFAIAGPIAALFMDSPTLDVTGYSKGLGAQAVIFLVAALIVFLVLRDSRPTEDVVAQTQEEPPSPVHAPSADHPETSIEPTAETSAEPIAASAPATDQATATSIPASYDDATAAVPATITEKG